MLNNVPDVFIIESLNPDDEGNGRFEGSVISNILRPHGKNPRYTYVRMRESFEEAIEDFGRSGYRYLHISAHGNAEGMETTNQEPIDYDELGDMLAPHLSNKRLSLSACSMVHADLAADIIPKTDCFSVIGPEDDIEFHRAAVFWAALYHLMFIKDADRMNRARLSAVLRDTSKLFEVNINFYYRSNSKRGFGESEFSAEKQRRNPKIGR